MTPASMLRHHPDEALLARFAGGDLPLGRRVVLEGHLAFCPECCKNVGELARAGGRHLATADALPPPPGLWGKIAARLEAPPAGTMPGPFAGTPVPAGVVAELPPRAAALEWNLLPGTEIELCHLGREEHLGIDLLLLQGPPGSAFPYHRHLGTEDLLILQGGLEDQHAHLVAGEIFTYEAGTGHAPVLDHGEICWALTAVTGGVDFTPPAR